MSIQDVEVVSRRGRPEGKAVRPADPSKQVAPIGEPPGALDSAGMGMWRIAADSAKWLSVTDAPVLFAACLAYQRYVDMDRQYWEYSRALDGPIDAHGLRLAKELAVMHSSLNRSLADMGLTPKARNEQGLAEVKLRSKMDNFMAAQRDKQQQKRYAREGGNADVKKERKKKGIKRELK